MSEQRVPHLCPLLLQALHVQQYAALALVHDSEQYVLLWVDGDASEGEELSLTLDVLPYGSDALYWWGDIRNLVPVPLESEVEANYLCEESKPKRRLLMSDVDRSATMSYTKQDTDWTQAGKMKEDVQKILKCLRREKYTQFYEDVSRCLSHATAIGCEEFCTALLELLESELKVDAVKSNAMVQKHGVHVVQCIRFIICVCISFSFFDLSLAEITTTNTVDRCRNHRSDQ